MFLLEVLHNSIINYLIFNLTFYLANGVLFLIDYFKLFARLKIQTEKTMSTSVLMDTYKKSINVVLWNTLVCIIPIICVFGLYEASYVNEFTILKFITDIAICRILTEILFYVAHRIFHLNMFYQYVHKKHHEITTPVGITSVYMTFTDLYIGNIMPVYLPMILLGAHPITIKIWIFITTMNTIIFAHSGFKVIAEAHDYHHSNFNRNFGTDLFMDRLFGTAH